VLRGLARWSLVLAVAAWLLCGLLYMVEWSRVVASPVRLRLQGDSFPPPLPPWSGGWEERDETHYMFGHGGVFIHSMTVYTPSFPKPNSDLNSHVLSWAHTDSIFPSWPPWRWDNRYRPGPLIGIRLWPVGMAFTLAFLLFTWTLRRQILAGHCVRCRYDLRGVVAHDGRPVICPECGSADQ